jgi:hypothetical protein
MGERLDLEAIRNRAEAATPGPWEDSYGAAHGFVCDEPTQILGVQISSEHHIEDAAFIAHAREDVGALVAEVERLREMLHVIRITGPERESALAREALEEPG